MSATVAQDSDEKASRPTLFVLGMHRSGTSALTGALRLSGAWVGEETELTEANVENPLGFWERRDMRKLCDELLHSAGADWWKIANFDAKAIPDKVLAKQRRKFEKIVSRLDKYDAWVIKEPRLCLLLPALRYQVKKPVCLHIYRNPLEVARSLQARNGFSISAGLALWEVYNLHALNASEGLPRISLSYEALMSQPLETLDALVNELERYVASHQIKPNRELVERFIDVNLYHQKATDEETEKYLLPSQSALWLRLRNGEAFDYYRNVPVPAAAKQSLFDLESAETLFNHRNNRINELEADLKKHVAIVDDSKKRISALEASNTRHKANLQERNISLQASKKQIGALEASNTRYKANLRARNISLQASKKRVGALETANTRLTATNTQLTANLKARAKTIDDLYNSTSWKITAPLRQLSLAARWLVKNLRRPPRQLFWSIINRFLRAVEIVRSWLAQPGVKTVDQQNNGQLALTTQLSKLIRECRQEAQTREERASSVSQENSISAGAKTRVTVIGWDLGHNPIGRTYLLADILRNDYEVELLGANFPRFGEQVWEPLRNCSRVTIKSFPGCNFPEHFEQMEEVAQQVEGDIIYVSKPRLPGLELAILAKLHRNRPVILDIDDYEVGFFKNRGPITLKQAKNKRRSADFITPHGETWTRYAESLIPLFEQVTVSNEVLQKKFGGMILPHIRDEHDFNPSVYPRDTLRASLGFSRTDKIILFAGTPRIHKGVRAVVAALQTLNRPDYKLLLIGSPADNETRRFFKNAMSGQVKVLGNIPFSDLPGYLCIGDLICLLQDRDHITSHFQMPAKFTDALSMGIPILATNVPPLENLAKQGLVELLNDAPLEQKIDEIFSDYGTYKYKAMQNRQVFLREYSYEANLPRLKDTIDRLLSVRPEPISGAFDELISYHRRIFSTAVDASRARAKIVVSRQSTSESEMTLTTSAAQTISQPRVKSYIDDKIDIVFFWKQNDTGIYGRRQDMIVKYLADEPRIRQILHFDAPVNIFRSGYDVLKSAEGGRHSHARLVLRQTLRRKFGRNNSDKIQFDTFVFASGRHVFDFWKRVLPAEEDYPDYLARVMERHRIGERRTIFWVCPNNFEFPSLADRFKPDLVISDVIDDQRTWPCKPEYKEKLHGNYREILARSDLTIANCRSVFESMQEFTGNIHLIPNACELLWEQAKNWEKPAQLTRIQGPVVGYVGNLDITRIDLDLLVALAAERPDWNLVLIGSMHRSDKIKELKKFKNVYFLGVQVYDQAVRFIRHFDVAMIPHLDNDLTRNMNPLKLYVYFSLHVPVVTTPIANTEDFQEFIEVGRNPEEFIERISYCLENNPLSDNAGRVRNLLEKNAWNERVTRLLTLIDREFTRRERSVAPDFPLSACVSEDGYPDLCTVCGHTGYLHREEPSIRETYRCGNCGASLRYREQARLILEHFSRETSECLADLVNESEFQNLKIYEPGLIGPFRNFFQKMPGYHSSYFWEDLKPGQFREGVQCQDLMNITFEDNSFDLVLSSDIFEHVRRPFVGLKEVNRVLKPGGYHIFSIPSEYPMPAKTVFRVDTSGPENVFVLPKRYNSAPGGGKSLVYTDFGADMVEIMSADGIDLKIESPCSDTAPTHITNRMLSFYWKK